jgi:hypothetical protein
MFKEVINLFRKPTTMELASHELAEAEMALLSSHTAVEYARAMVNYQNERIKRLKSFLATYGEQGTLL